MKRKTGRVQLKSHRVDENTLSASARNIVIHSALHYALMVESAKLGVTLRELVSLRLKASTVIEIPSEAPLIGKRFRDYPEKPTKERATA